MDLPTSDDQSKRNYGVAVRYKVSRSYKSYLEEDRRKRAAALQRLANAPIVSRPVSDKIVSHIVPDIEIPAMRRIPVVVEALTPPPKPKPKPVVKERKPPVDPAIYREKLRLTVIENKFKAVELLGGKCIACGSTDRLEFKTPNKMKVNALLTRWNDYVVGVLKESRLVCVKCNRGKALLKLES